MRSFLGKVALSLAVLAGLGASTMMWVDTGFSVQPKDYHLRQAYLDDAFLGSVQFATRASEPADPQVSTGNGFSNLYVNRDGDNTLGDTGDLIYKDVDPSDNVQRRKVYDRSTSLRNVVIASGDSTTWVNDDYPDTPANTEAYFFVLSDTPTSSSGASYNAQIGDVISVSADGSGNVKASVVGDNF